MFTIDTLEVELYLKNIINNLDKLNPELSTDMLNLSKNAPVDTGLLKSNTKSSYSNNTSTVYNNTSYAGYVQYGTVYTQPRPFIIEDEDIITTLVENLIIKAIN